MTKPARICANVTTAMARAIKKLAKERKESIAETFRQLIELGLAEVTKSQETK